MSKHLTQSQLASSSIVDLLYFTWGKGNEEAWNNFGSSFDHIHILSFLVSKQKSDDGLCSALESLWLGLRFL